MNDRILWRIAWKEFRTQRTLWVSVMALGVVFIALFSLAAELRLELVREMKLDAGELHILAALATALFAMAAGAIAFAQEREEETLAYLQQLPASTGPIMAGKLLVVVLGIVLLWGALLTIGGAWWPSFTPVE